MCLPPSSEGWLRNDWRARSVFVAVWLERGTRTVIRNQECPPRTPVSEQREGIQVRVIIGVDPVCESFGRPVRGHKLGRIHGPGPAPLVTY